MKIKVCQKIDYIAEGMALLQHLGRKEKYYILKEKIDKSMAVHLRKVLKSGND